MKSSNLPSAPRYFRKGDLHPDDVTAVMERDRTVWVKGEANDFWFCGYVRVTWEDLVDDDGCVEVVLPEFPAHRALSPAVESFFDLLERSGASAKVIEAGRRARADLLRAAAPFESEQL